MDISNSMYTHIPLILDACNTFVDLLLAIEVDCYFFTISESIQFYSKLPSEITTKGKYYPMLLDYCCASYNSQKSINLLISDEEHDYNAHVFTLNLTTDMPSNSTALLEQLLTPICEISEEFAAPSFANLCVPSTHTYTRSMSELFEKINSEKVGSIL